MVLYNPDDAQALVTDNHWVPSVHINFTDGSAVKAYIASAGASATAQINGGEKVSQDAPWMADFSSRGPNVVALDIIKPDLTAPGVNVLAGNTPNPFLGAPGQLFQSISGTSMASPHVAGVFALLKQAHPDWSAGHGEICLDDHGLSRCHERRWDNSGRPVRHGRRTTSRPIRLWIQDWYTMLAYVNTQPSLVA